MPLYLISTGFQAVYERNFLACPCVFPDKLSKFQKDNYFEFSPVCQVHKAITANHTEDGYDVWTYGKIQQADHCCSRQIKFPTFSLISSILFKCPALYLTSKCQTHFPGFP